MASDPTLEARLLLSGAAVELPIVTGTRLRPLWGGYMVSIECEQADFAFVRWCKPDELTFTVRWMVTCVWAIQERSQEAQSA